MKTSRILTIRRLIKAGACTDQVVLFHKTFGSRVNVTVDRAVAVADKFDFAWAARNLLSSAARADYKRVTAAARADYKRVKAAALADYERVTAPAWADYERVGAAALADYDRVRAAAVADYVRVTAPARADHERVRAAAWAAAYIAEGGV